MFAKTTAAPLHRRNFVVLANASCGYARAACANEIEKKLLGKTGGDQSAMKINGHKFARNKIIIRRRRKRERERGECETLLRAL